MMPEMLALELTQQGGRDILRMYRSEANAGQNNG